MSINWMTGHLARWAQAALLVLVLVPSLPAQAENGLAPNFTLRDINGANVTLSSLKGEVVMISFWATWCAPCKQEMPHLDAIRQDFGVKVLSISTDDARASSKVKAYIKSQGDMKTSANVLQTLSDKIRSLCDEAVESARSDGRKTVLDRDIP